MIIAEINYSGNEKIYLNLAKNKIRNKFDLYKKLLQDIINQFTEEHIYEAIDTLYLVDRKIFCPTNGFYGQVLRALEYGTGKNKSYKIISEALRELAREVGKNEFIVKL